MAGASRVFTADRVYTLRNDIKKTDIIPLVKAARWMYFRKQHGEITKNIAGGYNGTGNETA